MFVGLTCHGGIVQNQYTTNTPANLPIASLWLPYYGAIGDGQIISNASFNASSATLTVPSARFTTADVGKSVEAFGIGSSGALIPTHTTIISYISSTQVTFGVTSANTISNTRVDYGHDDTAAVNAALVDSTTMGIPILCPAKTYFIDGAFTVVPSSTPTAYAQLQLPIRSLSTNTMATVAIYGSIPPAPDWNNIPDEPQPPTTNVTIFLSSRMPPQLTNCCVLGIPTPVTTNAFQFSALRVVIKNSIWRTINCPQTTPLDFSYVGQLDIKGVVIDTGNIASLLNNPTNAFSYGIKSPRISNWALVLMDDIEVIGYQTAFQLSEHVVAGLLSSELCVHGIEFAGAPHDLIIQRFLCQETANPIWASAFFGEDQTINIMSFDVENGKFTNGVPAGVNLAWANTTNTIYDPNNHLYGMVNYHGATAFVGLDPSLSWTGMNNLHVFNSNIGGWEGNYGQLNVIRADRATQYAEIQFYTYTNRDWNIGTELNSDDLFFYSFTYGGNVMTLKTNGTFALPAILIKNSAANTVLTIDSGNANPNVGINFNQLGNNVWNISAYNGGPLGVGEFTIYNSTLHAEALTIASNNSTMFFETTNVIVTNSYAHTQLSIDSGNADPNVGVSFFQHGVQVWGTAVYNDGSLGVGEWVLWNSSRSAESIAISSNNATMWVTVTNVVFKGNVEVDGTLNGNFLVTSVSAFGGQVANVIITNTAAAANANSCWFPSGYSVGTYGFTPNTYSGMLMPKGTTLTNLLVEWIYPSVPSTTNVVYKVYTNGVASPLQATLNGPMTGNAVNKGNSGTTTVTLSDDCFILICITTSTGSIPGGYASWSCQQIIK